MLPRTLIIGGGLGGLATALALARGGAEVTVFERQPELSEVGAGVVLWPNAMHALARLGLAEPVLAAGHVPTAGTLRTWRGGIITTPRPPEGIVARFGMPIVAVHRATLLRLLGHAVGAASIRLGIECVGIQHEATAVVAQFADGRTQRGELLIGADGLRSRIRAELFGQKQPRYCGITSWRGITHLDRLPPTALVEGQTWDQGRIFGIYQIDNARVYWFATSRAPERQRLGPASEHARLMALFGHWHRPIPQLIAATDPERILRTDLYDRPALAGWSVGRVTLLGDAAHPMLPMIGMGASQALEDTIALADALATQPNVPDALRDYQHRRVPRTSDITHRSRAASWQAGLRHPLAVGLRNTILRATPTKTRLRQLDTIIGTKG